MMLNIKENIEEIVKTLPEGQADCRIEDETGGVY